MKKTLLFSIIISFCSISYSQKENLSAIDAKDLKYFINVLTSDSLEGRGTGTIGQKKAANFISSRFKRLGLEKFDSTGYFEKFELTQKYWGEVYIKTAKKRFTNFVDICFMGYSPENEEAEVEVVFGGYGTNQQLDSIDVKNKLVLLFTKNLRSTYRPLKKLREEKAYGAILANIDKPTQFESIRRTYKNHVLQKHLTLPKPDSTDRIVKTKSQKLVALLNLVKIGREMKEFMIPFGEVKQIIGVPIRKLKKMIRILPMNTFLELQLKNTPTLSTIL